MQFEKVNGDRKGEEDGGREEKGRESEIILGKEKMGI